MVDNSDIDEATLFQNHMTGVQPLKNTNRAELCHPKTKPSKQPMWQDEPTSKIANKTRYSSDEIIHHLDVGLSRKQRQALQSGSLTPDTTLDLHRLTQDQALKALHKLTEHMQQTAQRLALVIHGKGRTDKPILKNLVFHYFAQIPQTLAIVSAHPRHGGTGACYILLKKPSR